MKNIKELTINTKGCPVCKEEKSLSEFYWRRNRKNQHQSECKDCNRIRRRKWWTSEKGRRSSANTRLKQRFGVTIEEYEEMLEAAGNKCEICEVTRSTGGKRLGIDHDHKTGKFRGILCDSCNLGIGNFKDNISILKKAIKYLRDRH